MIDHSRLKELALDVPEGIVAPAAYDDDRPYSRSEVKLLNLLEAATPAVVLALIAENERVKARLCVCRDCGGQGEVYSGHSSYHGHNQPPEPDMDVCGTCGGDGVLGSLEDFEALAEERDRLKAEVEALRKDADRYEWLRVVGGGSWTVMETGEKATLACFDQCIDAAMGKGEQS